MQSLFQIIRGFTTWFSFGVSTVMIVSCGRIIAPGDGPGVNSPDRRLYANDAAANDSLTPALVRTGVRFVLQPAKNYALSFLANEKNDQLAVFYYDDGGNLRKYQTYSATVQGAQESFYLKSDQTRPRFFVAQLLPPDGELAVQRLQSVKLISLGTASPNNLKIKLIFVGKLQGMATDAAKTNFANSFFKEIAAIFSPHGLSVEGMQEIVDAQGPARVVPFSSRFTPLDGTRSPGYVHFYLVDSIAPPANADPGGYILGFSPREAIDLSSQPESRVVLGNRYISISSLATTAAHELGHFFGLRHPTATDIDMDFDKDFSNYDDGLTSTSVCDGLAKKAAGKSSTFRHEEIKGPGGLTYCLRVASTTCPSFCDLNNLMFAYDCSTRSNTQRQLTQDQIALWKKNLGVMQ